MKPIAASPEATGIIEGGGRHASSLRGKHAGRYTVPPEVREAAVREYLANKGRLGMREVAKRHNIGWMSLYYALKNIREVMAVNSKDGGAGWRSYPDEIQRRMIETDLLFCARDVLNYRFDPKTKEGICDPPDEVHLQMAEDIERDERYKMFWYPRYTYKTTILIVARNIQRLCRDPENTTIIATDPIKKARAIMLEICGHLETNEDLIRLYGKFKPPERGYWNKSEIYINQRKRPFSKEPSIMIAGLKTDMTGKHPRWIDVDDMLHTKNMTTPEQQEKVFVFFEECIHLTGDQGHLTIDGTPKACDDPSVRIRNKWAKIIDGTSGGEGENSKLFFFRSMDLEKADGATIMPHKYTAPYVKLLKEITPVNMYACEYRCNPMAGDNTLIKPYDLERCQYDSFMLKRENFDCFMTIDPGSALSSKKCYTGINLGILQPPYDLWIDYSERVRAEPSHILDKVLDIVSSVKYRDRVKWIGVETVSFQKIYKGSLQNALMKAGHDILVVPLTPDDSKDNRIYNLEPYFRHGQIHILSALKDLIYQVGHYPHIAKYNRDLIDALAYFAQLLGQLWIVNPEGIIQPSEKKVEEVKYRPPEEVAGYDDEEMLAGIAGGREW